MWFCRSSPMLAERGILSSDEAGGEGDRIRTPCCNGLHERLEAAYTSEQDEYRRTGSGTLLFPHGSSRQDPKKRYRHSRPCVLQSLWIEDRAPSLLPGVGAVRWPAGRRGARWRCATSCLCRLEKCSAFSRQLGAMLFLSTAARPFQLSPGRGSAYLCCTIRIVPPCRGGDCPP